MRQRLRAARLWGQRRRVSGRQVLPAQQAPGDQQRPALAGLELAKAGISAGDLIVATEASARTIMVRCATSCTVRYVAVGPAIAHAEGHSAFALVTVS